MDGSQAGRHEHMYVWMRTRACVWVSEILYDIILLKSTRKKNQYHHCRATRFSCAADSYIYIVTHTNTHVSSRVHIYLTMARVYIQQRWRRQQQQCQYVCMLIEALPFLPQSLSFTPTFLRQRRILHRLYTGSRQFKAPANSQYTHRETVVACAFKRAHVYSIAHMNFILDCMMRKWWFYIEQVREQTNMPACVCLCTKRTV